MKTAESHHLVLLEDREQVFWIKATNFFHSGMILVAITANALEALEELNLPCYSVADITDTSPLVYEEDQYVREIFSTCKEIEKYIGEKIPEFEADGPGFLSGNYYILQYSISSIVKRAYILREIVRAFSPYRVTAFQKDIDIWFKGCGYVRNPWDDILEKYSIEYNFSLNFIKNPAGSTNVTKRHIDKLFFVFHGLRKRIIWILHRPPKQFGILRELDGIRLIFVNSTIFDWGPVISRLQLNEKISLFKLESYLVNDVHWWSTTFAPPIKRLFSFKKYSLPSNPTPLISDKIRSAESLFNEWLSGQGKCPEIIVLGVNVFPYLVPQIKTLIIHGLEIKFRTDQVITEVLKTIQPHAVCFFNITLLSERRLTYLCEKNNITTICYQHGFGYNFQIQPKDEGCDQACAEYFLAYGTGNNPRTNPVFPVKARFVPVGSARIEQMGQQKGWFKKKRTDKYTVLWIADTTTQNTLVATLTEDTKRYKIQKNCLELLSNTINIEVIYRPLISHVHCDGTSAWIKYRKSLNISIDPFTLLEELIIRSDIVILDISSPTTWGEVLGLRKPFILYCDPVQTPIKDTCVSDLESTCCWCKSEEQLYKAVRRLIADPERFISDLEKIDTTPFLKKYILHDGNCAERVCSFFQDIYRGQITGRDN